jgi:hypothetical protein
MRALAKHKNITSFLIAMSVAVVVLGAWHFVIVRSNENGTAYASVGPAEGEIINAHNLSTFEKMQLRRTLAVRPDGLLLMTGRDIESMLKAPGLVRKDYPTIVWQYRSESCVLDVYLASMDEDTQKAPVVHYEVRSRNGKSAEDTPVTQTCLRELL